MYIVKVAYDFVWIAIIIHCTNARKITNLTVIVFFNLLFIFFSQHSKPHSELFKN